MKIPVTLNPIWFILVLSLGAFLPMASSLSAETAPLVLQSQGSFFVGGHDIHSDTLSTVPDYFDPVGTITVDQMYVHYEIPVSSVKRYPITFVHGCCLTGKSWEETPDGRMGWDDFFVRKGYPVYVIDQAERGRSAANAVAIPTTRLGDAKPGDLPHVLSASHEASWRIFRFGPKYPEVFPGLQFPLEAKVEFWKQMVPDWNLSLPKPNPTVIALGELADRLDGTILVSHSQSGIYPFLTAASGDHKIAAIVAIEPACPAATDPMTPFTKMPIMVLWGDNIEVSPIWAPSAVACDAFVAAVNKAGGHAEAVRLPSVGFHGNSHMLMLDKNSLEVAAWLADYMETHFPKPN
jgi:hypothetical protein